MPTLILSRKDISGLISMPVVIQAVEQAFKDWAVGLADMPSKVYLTLPGGDFRAMPASLPGAAGIKWVNVHPGNRALHMPTVMGLIIYSDPDTGYPLAIMDGTDITAYRTGAAAAIASRYLARQDATTLGIIGAGRQAITQIMAHKVLFELREIRVYDISPDAGLRLIEYFPDLNIRQTSLEETAASDIICTLTTSTKPVLFLKHLKPGCHINAVGADAPGKQELDPLILKQAVVVVDDMDQAIHAGELNVPVKAGAFNKEMVKANLGQILMGGKSGRSSVRDITVFDSTGVAIEDIAVAKWLYQRASNLGTFLSLPLVE
ncbi:alanine dehydrogenase [Dehalococcoides mccartyi]|jgi:alanine dehydrogenase|uniref:Putative alanine dehydrogenase n=2 Tax=Dehalococcoides mccartyi TaxID=61435 RepID=A0A142V9A0_9CHLR|nr:alanine dehydrogenase [Dehalococcoides mccartyi]AGG07202.1 ornithine cyclodeaminase [Dehalococcoides mccartyi BTF08]AII60353.1 alanine dehydrogenase [Dehalococcoides mccartyi CG5]AMU85927.1 ornithine cyclodeaminase [Dehalococcoides mccartyi]AOV98801.1 ornithine cyclodeaminase [Dehalococcoides mccartyi]AQW61855.1 ornithine cyclodeaminase family protein [Dehalococcoides mccartyi]